jgi:hypothetical protein
MKDIFVYYNDNSYEWEYLGHGMAYCSHFNTHADIKKGKLEYSKFLPGELEFLRRLMFRAELAEVLK